jgi:hypothetical protein
MREVWLNKNADINKLKYWNSNGNNPCKDVNEMSNRFTHTYLEMVTRYIPSKLLRIRLSDKH